MSSNGKLVWILVVLSVAWSPPATMAVECQNDHEQINSVSAGSKLPEAAIGELEASIKENPRDALLRLKASAFYLYSQRLAGDTERFVTHMLWLLENCPESFYVANLATYIDAQRMPEAYAKARGIWVQKLSGGGDDIRVTENAVKFLMLEDPELASKYLELGLTAEPDNERLRRYQDLLSK